jgi:hypothetical protein
MCATAAATGTWLVTGRWTHGSVLAGEPAGDGETVAKLTAAVDHLVLGAPDLDGAVAWLEKTAQVRAVAGGSHPGVGTRNALARLGPRQYLEIVAPDPAQSAYNFHIDVRKLQQPRLVAWAAISRDLAALAERARGAGHKLFGPSPGGRTLTNGKKLAWRTLGIISPNGQPAGESEVAPVPFFIEWPPDSPHPADDAPTGCEMLQFAIEHPQPETLQSILRTLGLAPAVNGGKRVNLIATLKTPKGTITLK